MKLPKRKNRRSLSKISNQDELGLLPKGAELSRKSHNITNTAIAC